MQYYCAALEFGNIHVIGYSYINKDVTLMTVGGAWIIYQWVDQGIDCNSGNLITRIFFAVLYIKIIMQVFNLVLRLQKCL